MLSQRVSVLLISWLALVLAVPFIVSAAEQLARSTDKEIRATIDSIVKIERSFERSLDSGFKKSVLRSPTVEVDVSNFLDDLSASISDLNKRVTTNYAASYEVESVLVRASEMHTYVRQNPSMKGASEWDEVAAALDQLAVYYGATFPLSQEAVVRRIGDGELRDAATKFGEVAGDLEKVFDKEGKNLAGFEDEVAAALNDLESVRQLSKDLASRVRSGKPASAVARQLLEVARQIDGVVSDPAVPDPIKGSWAEGSKSRQKIAIAFGLESAEAAAG